MRQARERLGLPQDQLGVLIGIDEHSASARMSRYESGVHEAPIATARLIAKVLNVPLAFLYCDDEDLAEILLVASQLPNEDRVSILKSMQLRLGQIKASVGSSAARPP
jgi:transcriptional regulator with XRE-family HTH domain